MYNWDEKPRYDTFPRTNLKPEYFRNIENFLEKLVAKVAPYVRNSAELSYEDCFAVTEFMTSKTPNEFGGYVGPYKVSSRMTLKKLVEDLNTITSEKGQDIDWLKKAGIATSRVFTFFNERRNKLDPRFSNER